ncbi:MAG: DUF2163 domain-containing protein [Pseudomonadota bacterium]
MSEAALEAHLRTGATHICRCWSVTRRDGVVLGFTDHDQELAFDGIRFHPECGLSAKALASTTGLSVNNTDVIGVLASDAITEVDIQAGRYDGASVCIWLVQWDNTIARQVQFAGSLGEITRSAGGFQAELRGLSDALNQPQGRSYLKTCGAVLGDDRCRVNLNASEMSATRIVGQATSGDTFRFDDLTDFAAGWFQGGRLEVETGEARGLSAIIREDVMDGGIRVMRLWDPIGVAAANGDRIRLIAGCDKRVETCQEKFSNFINFQGFPDIPGDDWLVSVPRSSNPNQGGSRSR